MSLFNVFPPNNKEQWLTQLLKDLKGKPLDALDWQIENTLKVSPLADISDVVAEEVQGLPHRRGNIFQTMDKGWQAVQEIWVDSQDVEGQIATALKADIRAFFFVSKTDEIADFMEAIAYLSPNQHAIHIKLNHYTPAFFEALYNLFIEKGWNTQSLTGTFHAETDFSSAKVEAIFRNNSLIFPYFRDVYINLNEYENSLILQLALACTKAVDEIENGKKEGLVVKDILPKVAFHFPVSSNFWAEVAKIRAFRVMYARICEVYGLTDAAIASPFLVSYTAYNNKTTYDSYNNLLRTSTEAISAILGGTNALIVRDFEANQQVATPFSQRMARNIHHLLQEEAHLDKVTDALGGAYYIEKLTNDLAEKAWKLFQEIEKKGKEKRLSFVNETYNAEVKAQKKAIRSRKKIIVGVNQYPNTEEFHTSQSAVNLYNAAAEFEAIRNKIDAIGQAQGKRLSVHLLTFGDAAMANARALFSRNLIGCGGFAITEANTLPNEKPFAIVLCAADIDYFTETTKEIVEKISTSYSSKPTIILAGKPENWESLGADKNIYAGMDVVAFLEGMI